MSRYLEEAADLLRKAAATNETRHAQYTLPLMEGRERIAKAFTALAAVDKGLLPSELLDDVLSQLRDHG
ncbi:MULTISPECIES: hypothetical protein [unclassified Streptomyces]|uniref:hypothetical protein n=1 Tax=unclassified Streptomyces TaxID=2593676 RepID=UPI00369768D5